MEKDKVNTGRKKTVLGEDDMIQIAKEYRNEGMNVLKLANKWHVDQRRISDILREKGILKKKGGQTYYDSDEIIKKYKEGISIKEIASMIGCSYNTVWGHIRKYNRQVSGGEVEEKNKCKLNKVKIAISIGDTLEYTRMYGTTGDERSESIVKRVVVIDSVGDMIVCNHPEGFKETFTVFECKELFGKGKLKHVQKG